MYQIEEFVKMNILSNMAITKHAKERLEERGIKVDDIVNCINTGQIIKQYVDDTPLPSCLILGKSCLQKYMHIVISKDDEFIYVITAYFPDKDLWEKDLKTRKER